MTTSSEAASHPDVEHPSGAGGEEADIEAVYRSAYPRFLRVAQAITGDPDSGHDAVQEGFARALRGRRGLRRASALEPWLWRTVVNVARDRRRADERRRRREVGAAAPSGLAAREGVRGSAALSSGISPPLERPVRIGATSPPARRGVRTGSGGSGGPGGSRRLLPGSSPGSR
jgi:hypothetical protein